VDVIPGPGPHLLRDFADFPGGSGHSVDTPPGWGWDVGATEPHHGPHRGRGPRGYQRDDARILDDVAALFTRDAQLDASGITVTVENAEVSLAGTVADRQDRLRAEWLADRVLGVRDVHNHLRIRPHGDGR
jgi:hypothetical protein